MSDVFGADTVSAEVRPADGLPALALHEVNEPTVGLLRTAAVEESQTPNST